MGNPDGAGVAFTGDLSGEIAQLRDRGYGWSSIANSLNTRGVATSRGCAWSASTVKRHVEPGRSQWARYMATYRAGDWRGQ